MKTFYRLFIAIVLTIGMAITSSCSSRQMNYMEYTGMEVAPSSTVCNGDEITVTAGIVEYTTPQDISATFYWEDELIGTVESAPFGITYTVEGKEPGLYLLKCTVISSSKKGISSQTSRINDSTIIYVKE